MLCFKNYFFGLYGEFIGYGYVENYWWWLMLEYRSYKKWMLIIWMI